ncbi:MAG: ribokinase, partial [Akkermansiaceae bacterium]|nr:ribokinase [Akkermansiaceae bacterium]NIV19347.1 ribokinase [Gammaproteobacteria bacterium]
VTRGGESTLVISRREGCFEVPPPVVVPVDTVGAGDTFAGAFAVAHGEGVPLREAVEFANKAAALATQQPGAQSAIPRREAILGFEGAAG